MPLLVSAKVVNKALTFSANVCSGASVELAALSPSNEVLALSEFSSDEVAGVSPLPVHEARINAKDKRAADVSFFIINSSWINGFYPYVSLL